MGFLVDRWRTFFSICHVVQGRIHDVATLCGSEPNVPIEDESKLKLWNIYRLLQTAHIICFKSFSPHLKHLSVETDFTDARLGLLTIKEGKKLSFVENKARESTLALLAKEIKLLHKANDDPYAVNIALKQLCELRGAMTSIHDLFVRDNPNEVCHFITWKQKKFYGIGL